MENYKKKTNREHILERPNMYIGGIDLTTTEEYILKDDKILKQNISYIPGLIKIINEIIDNSVDVAIKTNFKGCNEIIVRMTEDFVEVQDNGTGIPVQKNDDEYLPFVCWGYAMSGSNFDNDKNRTSTGMNGIGSFCTNVWSKKFTGISDDGKNKYEVTFKNNASTFVETVKKSTGHGVTVKFYPDLERFNIEKIDEEHMQVIKQRLLNLSMSFPLITFKFNGKKINTNTFKKYIQLFNNNYEIIENEKYSFAIVPSNTDEFEQFSYVNGLNIKDGGTHIDVIANTIANNLRDSLLKKYKNLKPADVKNKLMVIGFFKDFVNPKFNSQTKEKITNSVGEVNSYLGNIDYNSLNKKLLKNSAIIDPIVDVFKIKEELKRKQELKALNKPKKIKDEHYIPATKNKKYLFIVEGDSALNSVLACFGRNDFGYFKLKGKPLNAWDVSQQKFTSNKELSGLYQVIKNENYENIVYSTDEDCDAYHIRALLSGFIHKYLHEFEDRVGMLETPIKATFKGDKIQKWTYELNDKLEVKQGETSHYYKGLGTWQKEDLQTVIETDGMDQMIVPLDFSTSEKTLDEWLGNDSEPRKVKIMNNDFSIADI